MALAVKCSVKETDKREFSSRRAGEIIHDSRGGSSCDWRRFKTLERPVFRIKICIHMSHF